MKKLLVLSALLMALSGCSGTGNPEFAAIDFAPNIPPIAGSLKYGPQSKGRYQKMPAGYTFTHEFIGSFGSRVSERYRVNQDGSIELRSRRISPIKF
ncbi:hypothetical protein GAO09_28775 [Rhizobiales bacterium RZME27]|uniref:Uncharacterized protein n=1 Tax=Endobacterium cereale TaxID=2663029 RepID=A0A6A8AJG4_9HYPH|nr:hypothetical protein [Endobacterium cereale]MEB2845801.1 hypothetical protein [Endobacterium cereale]MQY50028.1 hypothetical protein [Endobacterium cereale]